MSVSIYKRAIVLLLDGVGVGELPDAAEYGDAGSNTLGNLAKAAGGLRLPNLGRLGLGNIIEVRGVPPSKTPQGSYGKMAEMSKGKDSTSGHWEITGVVLDGAFPVYPRGFPPEIIDEFECATKKKVIGNKAASGTAIIEELGEEHLRDGSLIVYTSADSVFQIAAHEDVVPVDELYRYCGIARSILKGDNAVARVIARPFTGRPGSFKRTERRRDFSLPPPHDTLLDLLKAKDLAVVGIGKIDDLFTARGLTESHHSVDNMECMDYTLSAMNEVVEGLIFANFVAFDMLWGHRNDVPGFKSGLEEFDRRIPEVESKLRSGDVLFFTADHGNDPTTPSTDHSREYVPVIACNTNARRGSNLGTRNSFADLGATIGEMFEIGLKHGNSFLEEI